MDEYAINNNSNNNMDDLPVEITITFINCINKQITLATPLTLNVFRTPSIPSHDPPYPRTTYPPVNCSMRRHMERDGGFAEPGTGKARKI